MKDEKWIYHYFRIGVEKKKDVSKKEFEEHLSKVTKEILTVIPNIMLNLGHEKEGKKIVYKGSFKKNVNVKYEKINGDYYYMFIRFRDKGKEEKKGFYIKWDRTEGEEDEYKFSIEEFSKATELMRWVQEYLIQRFKIEPTRLLDHFSLNKEKKPIVTHNNGIQYTTYLLEKRIQSYLENKNLDKEAFGSNLRKYIKWIMNKREENDHMREYCEELDKLIEKYPEIKPKKSFISKLVHKLGS
jgi:hypothetical protein